MRLVDFFRALFRRLARFFQRRSRDIQGSPPKRAEDSEFVRGQRDGAEGRYEGPIFSSDWWESDASDRRVVDQEKQAEYDAYRAGQRNAKIRRPIDAPEPITFTAFHPHDVVPGQWADLLVYIGVPDARAEIFRDSERRLGLSRRDVAQQTIAGRLQHGTEVLVVPEIDDAEINPASARVAWLEPWHHVDFRFRLSPNNSEPRQGRISFYVGPLLVATLELFLAPGKRAPINFSIASPYRSIFVSYAHADRDIVDSLERAVIALGDTYLRDTKILRSGEDWNNAILGHIEDADVFQLCWSEDAKRSQYVEREWRHAHGLARRNFIRPMYWKEPMPALPAELASIQFRFVPFER